MIARLGIAMTPLALLLLVADTTGRYAAGGLAVGCYACAGAVVNPLTARLADRIGPASVLRVCAVAHAVVVVVLALLTEAGLPLLLVVSAVAGATYPPLTGAIRGAWATMTTPRPMAGTDRPATLPGGLIAGVERPASLSGGPSSRVGEWATGPFIRVGRWVTAPAAGPIARGGRRVVALIVGFGKPRAASTAVPVAGAGKRMPPSTGPSAGAGHQAALAAETSLFELIYVIGPLLVAALIQARHGYAPALLAAAAVTLLGGLAVARVPVMRVPRRVTRRPMRGTPGFGALLLCGGLLGAGFGAVTVGVPAFAAGHGGGAGLGGVLLGVWGLGSACGGFWFGTRRPAADPARRYAVLLAAIGVGFLALVAVPGPVVLAVVLIVGGVAMAPALTMENHLVSRIAPGEVLNEAYTRVITVAITSSAAGSAVAGAIVDRPGGVRWAFVLAGGLAFAGALVAGWPGGALARADRQFEVRLRAAREVARSLPALRPPGRRQPAKRRPAQRSRADQSRADQSRADQSRADQGRIDRDRADQGRADQGRADRRSEQRPSVNCDIATEPMALDSLPLS
jgi:MFS family permease